MTAGPDRDRPWSARYRRGRRWPRLPSGPEGWLRAVALTGWAGSGVAGHAGWIEWPVATLVSGVVFAPLLVYSTFVQDDDG